LKKTHQVPKGYKIHIHHFRRYKGVEGYIQKSEDMNGHQIRPNAGLTEAWLVDDEGKLVSYGEAKCGKRDNFSKKIGRNIATGRALKLFEEQASRN